MNKPKIYLVGGAVRDKLLGRKSKDMDYVVMLKDFSELVTFIKQKGGTIFVEKPEFGIIRAKLPNLGAADYALPRIDGRYLDGRHPENVTFTQSIEEDLGRRDSTINAMAEDVETGDIVDPYGGMDDLRSRVINAVGSASKRIEEDKLRVFRYLRQSAQLNLSISTEIYNAIKELKISDFDSVSTERIYEEVKKGAEASPTFFFTLFLFYPQLFALIESRGIKIIPSLKQ